MSEREVDLGQALEQCLERIRQGASLEESLRERPDLAVELGPLLRVAMTLEGSAALTPPEAARDRGQARFDGAVRLHLQRRERLRGGWFAAWMRPWAMAAASLAAFVVLGGGALWASADSLPSQPLYSVKRAAERVQLVMARSPEDQAQVHLSLADERVREIARLAQEGRAADLQKLQEDLSSRMRYAHAALGGGGAAAALAEVQDAAAPGATSGSGQEAVLVATDERPSGGNVETGRTTEESQEPQDDALAPHLRAFLREMETRSVQNLALLHLLQSRASSRVRAALEQVIEEYRRQYAVTMRDYAAAGVEGTMDVRSRLLQVDALVQRQDDSWTIAGRRVRVTESTRVTGGALAPGDVRRISGVVQPDGSLLAMFIETGASREGRDEGLVEVSGVLEGKPGTGHVTLGGYVLKTNPAVTQVEGATRRGHWAHAVGTLNQDNELMVHRMTVSADGP